MKVLVTGAAGQLGSEFKKFFQSVDYRNINITYADHSRLDIADYECVKAIGSDLNPDIYINCAAYNKVDEAESNRYEAIRGNVLGPRNLAAVANSHLAVLIHFSTDYVFNGNGVKQCGYNMADVTTPLSWYGQTKLRGEEEVRYNNPRSYIIRLSSVFGGKASNNFVTRIRQLAREQKFLDVTATQVSSVTYTADVVPPMVQLLLLDREVPFGTYHFTNSGYVSRYDWAKWIVQCSGIDATIGQADYLNDGNKRLANRPKFSALDSFPLPKLPPWNDATERYIKQELDA